MERRDLEELVLKMFKNATPDVKETMFERLVFMLSFDELRNLASSEVLR